MVEFLSIGSTLGAVVGLLHGIYLYRQQTARAAANDPTGNGAAGLYYGLWAFVLWTLFGAYVLAFWLLGAVPCRLRGWSRESCDPIDLFRLERDPATQSNGTPRKGRWGSG
jgi:hypothetical protein